MALVVAFHSPSGVSTKTLFDDFGGDLDGETRREYLQLLKEEKYSTIVLLLRYPYNVYLEIPAHTHHCTSLRKALPMLVFTLLLKGGLYQIMLRLRFRLGRVACLCLS